MVLPQSKNQIPRKELTPGESNSDYGAIPAFFGGGEGEFLGDLYGKTKLLWKGFWEEQSRRERDRYLGAKDYERVGEREHRNGFYQPHFVTLFGTLVLRVARSRGQSFLPGELKRFQRRAPEVMMLIREAFLRGISTRQVGQVVATVTQEVVMPRRCRGSPGAWTNWCGRFRK